MSSGGKKFEFSKGHGAFSDTGGLKRGKTEIRPSAVSSVREQRSKGFSGGSHRFGAGPVGITFVPRRSKPTEFRAIGTKTGGGGSKGSTSFPISVSKVPPLALGSLPKGSSVVDEPLSPPPSPRLSPSTSPRKTPSTSPRTPTDVV